MGARKDGLIPGTESARLMNYAVAGSVRSRGRFQAFVESEPSIQVLADGGEHHAEEPTLASGSAGLLEQVVVLLALVRTLDATMMIIMFSQQVGVTRERCEEPIVGLGIGVDDAPIRGG